MKIAVVGTGYVGLVTGTCFSDLGIDVTCVDIDHAKIEGLRNGVIPIYEPGLEEMVRKSVQGGRLHFETSLAAVIDDKDVIFSAVGTPADEDGSADLRYVMEVAREMGRTMNSYKLLINKSTVPVGTAAAVRRAVEEELRIRGVDIEFDVASNPEFLKEGDAINDFSHPSRIVIGVESARARELMDTLYGSFILNGTPVIYMDIPSAEMTKYAANAMLATRISFMNDIANLCDLTGADVNMVRRGIGTDERIGDKFLNAGCGYGGSCFPKDVQALISTGLEYGYRLQVLQAVEAVNEAQKSVVFKKLADHFDGQIAGRTIAVWGLSFKPNTDDMRVAPSLTVIASLLAAGCRVRVYDPVSHAEARKKLGGQVHYGTDMYDATRGAEAILLMTEWKDFRMPNWQQIRQSMAYPLVVDGRNVYDKEHLQAEGFLHIGVGTK